MLREGWEKKQQRERRNRKEKKERDPAVWPVLSEKVTGEEEEEEG